MKTISRYLKWAILSNLVLFLIFFSVLASAENKLNPAIPLLLLDDSNDASPRVYDLDEVVQTILDRLGEDDAFDAVVLALDKGYSVRQIVEAGLSGRLRVIGDITDSSGNIITPEYPPSGVIIPDTTGVERIFLSEAAIPPKTISEFKEISEEEAKKIGLRVLLIIIQLADQGYSPIQILEAFYDPTYRIEFIEYSKRIVSVFDQNGNRIQPERQPEKFVFSNALGPIFGDRTVYRGHDNGGSCPGTKFIQGKKGDPITECFEITNYCDSELSMPLGEPGKADNTFWFLDSNYERGTQFRKKSGSLPLKPNEKLIYYAENVVTDPSPFQVSSRRCLLTRASLPGDSLDKRDQWDSRSCTSVMSGKPGYPYADVSLFLTWDKPKKPGEPASGLGIAAVKDNIKNFKSPFPPGKVYEKKSYLFQVNLPIPKGGHYYIAVYIHQPHPVAKVVHFELTLRVKPYKWIPEKGKVFAEEMEMTQKEAVEQLGDCPIDDCEGYKWVTDVEFQDIY